MRLAASISVSFAIVAVSMAAGAAFGQAGPEPVRQLIPDAPKTPFGTAMEGWVRVRYSVLADGTTANVRAVEVMPPQLDARPTVAAAERWTFQPAPAGAQAAEWHNNESTLVF